MKRSNAAPIQMWLPTEPTFNEKYEPGIDSQDYYEQIFDEGDPIKDQFEEPTALPYSLLFRDTNNVILKSVDYTNTSGDFYETTTIFNFLGLLNKLLFASIIDSTMAAKVLAPNTSWANAGGGLGNWVRNATSLSKAATGGAQTVGAYQLLAVPNGNKVVVHLSLAAIGMFNAGTFFVAVRMWDGDETAGGIAVATYSTGSDTVNFPTGIITPGVYNLSIELTPSKVGGSLTGDCVRLYIEAGIPSTSSAGSLEVSMVSGDILYSAASALMVSDPISIEHNKDSRLIQYSNKYNFAGLDYSNSSIFAIRLVSKFFQREFPETDEIEDLSDGEEVSLSGSMKSQTLLETEAIPYYILEKLKLVLKHNTINIDNVYWTKPQQVDKIKLDDHAGMVLATALLTQRDSYVTNVYGEAIEVSSLTLYDSKECYQDQGSFIGSSMIIDGGSFITPEPIPSPRFERILEVDFSQGFESFSNFGPGIAWAIGDWVGVVAPTPPGDSCKLRRSLFSTRDSIQKLSFGVRIPDSALVKVSLANDIKSQTIYSHIELLDANLSIYFKPNSTYKYIDIELLNIQTNDTYSITNITIDLLINSDITFINAPENKLLDYQIYTT